MKRENEILVKLDDVFLMNEIIEKEYVKVCEKISNKNLKVFLKKKSLERYKFGQVLQNEIDKFGVEPEKSILTRRRAHFYIRSFNNLLQMKNNNDLLNAIYKIEMQSLEKCNALLREMNLSLSLCKLLIKQVDNIQYGLRLLKKEEFFSATVG